MRNVLGMQRVCSLLVRWGKVSTELSQLQRTQGMTPGGGGGRKNEGGEEKVNVQERFLITFFSEPELLERRE